MRRISGEVIRFELDFTTALRKAISRGKVAPVDLSRGARWKLDFAGLVAIQFLLVLWQLSQRSDEPYDGLTVKKEEPPGGNQTPGGWRRKRTPYFP
jgi:hypothetical protein